MCGIAGVYSLTDRPPDPEWGRILTRVQKHRGPDGDGVYADDRVVLAHTRLAIIDLSEAGRQPMHSEDGRRVIALNGEIYNHAAIRARLEREHGVVFRSRSDTEVLLTALSLRGKDALDELLGMFAFALYDRDSGDLLLARDRLGKKPLLYVRTPKWLAFASEAAALLALPFVRARLDRDALRDYARHLYVPAPATLLEGVKKLPPASLLQISPRGGDPARPEHIETYWSPACAGNGAAPRSAADLDRALEEVLLDATKLRTVSDVPIGVFLSGGLDSNAVLELLRRSGHRPIQAFTVGFHGLPDERPLAREGAKRFADEHVEIEVRPSVSEDIPRIIRHFGEPLGDSAVVTTYLIAREASRYVKVILNGDGGDELFGGYARYPFARRVDIASALPGGLALARSAYARRAHLTPVFDALSEGDPDRAARHLSSVLTPNQQAALLAPSIGESASPTPDGARSADLTTAVFEWDRRAYLPDDLLTKVDLASMAHGLENRSPFLDHRLFEIVSALPSRRRAHPFRTKPILRGLVRDRLPRAILDAPKRGFQLPLATWLRGPLAGWLDGLLLEPTATRALYREGATRSQVERFRQGLGGANAPYLLWGLAVLELWAREFNVEVPR